MFKVNNKATGVVLVSLLTYFTLCSNVSIVNFKHVTVGWDGEEIQQNMKVLLSFSV